ncbi:hypothetical protein ACHAWF_008723 [Thalassiosira exigua]
MDGSMDVDSNGLSFPRGHEMYLAWRDALECAAEAYSQVTSDEDVQAKRVGERKDERSVGRASLRTICLLRHLLETRGLKIAVEI